eukprot:4440782-Prymnesium_polylepis.1
MLNFDEFVEAYNMLIDRLATLATAPKLAAEASAASQKQEAARDGPPTAAPAQWTLREWVSTTDVDYAVAQALKKYAGGDGPDALAFLRGPCSSREAIERH